MKVKGVVDHLFRHQHGKMVATLVRIFGLTNLELIEDAVQDTFIKAMVLWRNGIPENPEAWLIKAAKNRTIDLFRKVKAADNRLVKLNLGGPSVMSINDLFLDHEIEDSQLRMIFTACHPKLKPKDQIAFALKTISGFSNKEIAAALLLKQETVKKRLTRARNTIKQQAISFSIPEKKDVDNRMDQVHQVLYLIFNEGFHSTNSEQIIRKELCGEAIRLCSLILKKSQLRTGEGYALFALFCFHAARLDAKLSDSNVLIDLKNQDRSKWYQPLIALGNNAMKKSMYYEEIGTYHLEAAIAAEHAYADSFETTNWQKILECHEQLYRINPSDFAALNLAVVLLQLGELGGCFLLLQKIQPQKLEKRAYLYYGVEAEYHILDGNQSEAIKSLDQSLGLVSNEYEKQYLEKKKNFLLTRSQ